VLQSGYNEMHATPTTGKRKQHSEEESILEEETKQRQVWIAGKTM